jgi:hypothetical protein
MEIILKNKKIIDFYKTYDLDPEQVNIFFVDILKKLMENIDTKTMPISRLLEKFDLLDVKMDAISRAQQDGATTFALKFAEYRKEYMQDMRLILSNNNVECISPLIKETNASFLDKTSLIINDLLPKNQDALSRNIFSHLQEFQTALTSQTSKATIDKESLEDFLKNVNQTCGQSQQILTSVISSKFSETERKISEMKEMQLANQTMQQALQLNVSEVLKKFENGSSKGAMSEHILYNILLSLFPCATIDHVGTDQKETGDIILIRNQKPKILIENKDHETKNVTRQEVDKFIRDCDIQNCCGIMFAQHRGICNKENFELQIHKNNVLLYMHNVNFDNDKIKNAIEVVEHFKLKLDEVYVDKSDHSIEQSVLEQINKEFEEYIAKKDGMVKMVKDFSEKMILSINEFKFPALEKYLSSRFAMSTVQNGNICKYCGRHFPRSVAQHQRHCAKKMEQDLKEGGSEEESNVIVKAKTSKAK